MNGTAVVLVLVGSVAHATWNLLVKRVPDGGRLFVWVYSALSVLVFLPVAAMSVASSDVAVRPSWLTYSLASAILHLAYALTLQWAYARSDMTITYPVARGFGPVVVVLFAAAFLGEHLSPIEVLGVVAVLAGVGVISWRSGAEGAGDAGQPDAEAGPSRTSGAATAVSGVLVGVTIAGYTLWDDHSMSAGIPPLPYYLGTVLFQFLVLTAVTAKRLKEAVVVFRAHWRVALGIAVLVPLSYVLVLLAMQIAPVSLVAPLRSTSIVMGSIVAMVFLRERNVARRLTGAVVVVLGVCAMTLT